MEFVQREFVQRLKELMQTNNINSYQLAKGAGVTLSTISVWTLGKSLPSIERLSKVAKFFDVSIDYLIGMDDIPNRRVG